MGGDIESGTSKLGQGFVMLMTATNESKNFIFRLNLVNFPKAIFYFQLIYLKKICSDLLGLLIIIIIKKKVKWPPVVSAAIYRSLSNLASDSICREACWMEWISNLKMTGTFRNHFQVPGSSHNKWEQIKFTSLEKKLRDFILMVDSTELVYWI